MALGQRILPEYSWTMVTSREDMFRGALSLSEQHRADLIAALIESLASEVEEGVEEAWRLEIERSAKEEANSAWTWYAERSSSAAAAFLLELDAAVRAISEAP